ncbi:hypothetical protein [Streptomyces hirsutus]|uniref:hypothetical protein n=1 Tax=Streptomyces hirsutus TaxID=35620 RepID=UPI0036BFBB96
MSTTLPATPPPDPSAQDADNDSSCHAVHVRIGRHFELKLYLSPIVLAALLGGGTTTTALAIVLAR